MEPEAAEAIRIADKHLPGRSPQERLALAKDIVTAIVNHAEKIALEEIKTATDKLRRERH